MPESIRYQVFVSSTFTDLTEERAEVLQAIWELDCIPTGMEAFLATNEAQWEVIQKVIEECDYYVFLIGGRYGSVTEEGMSYTEKEYNYAKSLGIPVLCFVHGDPDNIPVSKTEKETSRRLLLDAFRKRVMDEHPIRKWTNAQELGGVVSRSISRAIKVHLRPGWVRNTGTSNFELLERINNLTKENSDLKSKIELKLGIGPDELQSGQDKIQIDGSAYVYGNDTASRGRNIEWSAQASWDDLFREVGSILMNEATDGQISEQVGRFIGWDREFDRNTTTVRSSNISHESLTTILIQFRALGLLDKGTKKRAVSDRGSYWRLTEHGESHLINLLARKKITTQKPKLSDKIFNQDKAPEGNTESGRIAKS